MASILSRPQWVKGVLCETALCWMPQNTLVQIMVWCHQATSHYLSQCWPRSMLSYGITRPWGIEHKLPWPDTVHRIGKKIDFAHFQVVLEATRCWKFCGLEAVSCFPVQSGLWSCQALNELINAKEIDGLLQDCNLSIGVTTVLRQMMETTPPTFSVASSKHCSQYVRASSSCVKSSVSGR